MRPNTSPVMAALIVLLCAATLLQFSCATNTTAGDRLSKSLANELTEKDNQVAKVKELSDYTAKNLFNVSLVGQPQIATTNAAARTATVAMDWSASFNPDALRRIMSFITDLSNADSGDTAGSASFLAPGSLQPKVIRFKWYKEAAQVWLWQTYGFGSNVTWTFRFALLDNHGNEIADAYQGFGVHQYSGQDPNSPISLGDNKNIFFMNEQTDANQAVRSLDDQHFGAGLRGAYPTQESFS